MSNPIEIDKYEQFNGEEFEYEDLGDQDGIAKPFDPNKVDVNISTPNLGALISRLKNDEIDLMPEFQRSPDLWSKQAQSRLIESILIRLPIPAFYFDAYEDEKWQVVDGLQRLSAINNFVIKKTLVLTNLEFLTDYEGKKFDELPRSLTRRIDEFQTSVYLIKPGTPTLIKYALFNRINTGGLKLTPQEIRHAMSQSVRDGVASKFLTKIVHKDSFKLVVRNKSNRQAHQELVLRHMAFTLFGTQGYKSSLPKFLDLAMIELGELSIDKLNELGKNFIDTIKMAYKIFDEDAFKRSLADQHTNKVVNKPLFEAVSVSLARLNLAERETLVNNKIEFRSGLRALLQDSEFIDSITLSTANTENVLIRFEMVQSLINNILIEK
ncbi:DUF262 domain-containing protein [uncultured Psychromonas sp.]|uniref:DUF262 domain-containing protein n=1 Tax=uncultured Psychromonas sp. TaxID=173974 RepID=UPI002626DEAC|nr:DUF262 domain-containing protein [uncultured Psychromonas sp.]